jgi:hypothetical protein
MDIPNSRGTSNDETCQTQVFGVDTGMGAGYSRSRRGRSGVYVYNLNVIDRDGMSLASYKDNVNAFSDTVVIFRTGGED